MNVYNVSAFETRTAVALASMFHGLFSTIENVVECNPTWSDGGSFFSLAPTDDESVQRIGFGRSVADDGRKMIIVNADGRKAVFFQRFAENNNVICCHRDQRPGCHVVSPFSDHDTNAALEALVKAYNANQRRLEAIASQR